MRFRERPSRRPPPRTHPAMPPPDRDLVRFFKSARWDDAALADLVREVGAVSASELRAVLPLLTDRTLMNDTAAHRRRCAAFAALLQACPDPSLFVPMVRAIRSGEPTLRAALVPVVPRVHHADAHDELCQLLTVTDVEVRRAGATLLKTLGGRSAFLLVHEMVRDAEFVGRIEAMEAFAAKARHGAIPLLTEVLRHGSVQERARALAYRGDRELMAKDLGGAADVVIAALNDRDERIVGRAIDALAGLVSEDEFFERVGMRIDASSLVLMKAVVEALRRYASPRSIELLGRRFRAGPNPIRLDVLDSLEHIGTDDVLPVIADALAAPHMAVRERAGRVMANLSKAGKIDTARTVMWLLRSTDVNVRRIAVEVARTVPDRASSLWPRLLDMLRDQDWWVRERVMDTLAEIAGDQLTRYLVAMLDDPSDVVRRFAIGVPCCA